MSLLEVEPSVGGGLVHPPDPVLLRHGGGGVGGRRSRESWQRPRVRVRRPGIIRVILELEMVVQVMHLRIDGRPILVIVAVKSANIESVDDQREAGALTEGAVMANAEWEVPLRRGVEGDGLTVAKPHQEVRNCCLLLL